MEMVGQKVPVRILTLSKTPCPQLFSDNMDIWNESSCTVVGWIPFLCLADDRARGIVSQRNYC